MKNLLSRALMVAGLAAVSLVAEAQNSFSYQAVIRDSGKVLENKSVNLRLSLMQGDSVYYQELQSANTNAYGNVSVNVGEGESLRGSFANIPWKSMNVMLQVEVSTDGTNFTNMGAMQIQPVPYAFYAARTTVIQPSEATSEPIFQIKDNDGNLLFAVFETGVKVYVDKDDSGKAAKSKFAVAGRTSSKGELPMLTINANGSTVYVDDANAGKAAKSKFAVAGRTAKGNAELLTIDGSGSTIYVDGEGSGKAAKSRFAVAGSSAKKSKSGNLTMDGDGETVYVDFGAKSAAADVLTIDGDQATFFIDLDSDGKAAKSRFAVAGNSTSKGEQLEFVVDQFGSVIYIDDIDDSKAAKSRFAVAGRSADKGNNNFFTINRDSTRIYVNDAPDNTGTGTTPSLASAFSVASMTQNYDLLKVNKDSSVVRTGVLAAEEVQSTAGGVEKIIDDSKAGKYYSTGKINLSVEKMEGFETISSGSAEITYAYYHSNAGEYLYLDNQWGGDYHEYRNYWLADGKIYKDTTFVFSADRGLEPISESGLTENMAEDFTPADWNGENLLVILESKIRKSGYNVSYIDGVNHYYNEEDNEEVMQAKRNVVTSLYDAGIFSDNLTVFKTLLNPLYTISDNECDILDDTITEVMWSDWNIDEDGSYGYILIDDEINEENIIEKEKLQHRIDTTPQTEAEIYAQEPSLLCKRTLAEIESKFGAIKSRYSVKVAVSDDNNGTVTVKYGKNTKVNTSVSITRQYCQSITLEVSSNTAQNYMFAGWSDGNKENPRNMFVMRDINLTANIAKAYLTKIQSGPEGHVIISYNGEEETYNGGSTCEKMCLEGETITMTAVPEGDDCVFTGWSDVNQYRSPIISTEPTYNVTVANAMSLKAVFTKSFTATNADELSEAINSMSDGGTYNIYIDSDEKINGHREFTGDKKVTLIGVGDNVVLGCTEYTSIIGAKGPDITIRNLTLDGLYDQNQKGSAGIIVNAGSTREITLDNVKIKNFRWGVEFVKSGWIDINSGTEITNNDCGIFMENTTNIMVTVNGGIVADNSITDIYYSSKIVPVDNRVDEYTRLYIYDGSRVGTISMAKSDYYPNYLQAIYIGNLTYHTADNPIIVKFQTYKFVSGSGYGYYDDEITYVGNQLLEPNSSVTNLAEETRKFKLANEAYFIDESGYIREKPATSVAELIGKSAPNASQCPELTISTQEELIQLADWVNNATNTDRVLENITFKLTEDITLTDAFTAPIGTGYGQGNGFSDNGVPHKAFWGTFDGNGHTISGFNTDYYTTETTYPALFGNVAGTVKNLTVEGVSTGGGIVGCLSGEEVRNCVNKVNIDNTKGSSSSGECAGVVADARSGRVVQCVNLGTVISRDESGGIIGFASNSTVEVDSCTNKGTITGRVSVGGIVGYNRATIRNCVNMSNVEGTEQGMGGIAGFHDGSSSEMENCYNLGDIKGSYGVGGLLGIVQNGSISVSNCYNSGSVTATTTMDNYKFNFGGVLGNVGEEGEVQISGTYYLNGTATYGIGGAEVSQDAEGETAPFYNNATSIGTLLQKLNDWVDARNGYKRWTWEEGVDEYPRFSE